MQVDEAIDRLDLVLHRHPALDRAEIVAQRQPARGLDPGEDAGGEGHGRGLRLECHRLPLAYRWSGPDVKEAQVETPCIADHNASPFNALPPVVGLRRRWRWSRSSWCRAGAAGPDRRTGGGRLADSRRMQHFAFSGRSSTGCWATLSRHHRGGCCGCVTYPFVHGSFTHMLFAVVHPAGAGQVRRRGVPAAGAGRGLVCSPRSSAALAYALLTDDPKPLYGGMPPVYGLIGAFTFILWHAARVAAPAGRRRSG